MSRLRSAAAARASKAVTAGTRSSAPEDDRDEHGDARPETRPWPRSRGWSVRRQLGGLGSGGLGWRARPGHLLDDHAGQDREPGPGPEDGPQVVAPDVGIRVRGVEEDRDDHRGPGQERVAGMRGRSWPGTRPGWPRPGSRTGLPRAPTARRASSGARPAGPGASPGTARRGRRTRSRPRCRAGRRRAGPGRSRPGAAAPGRRGRGVPMTPTTQAATRRGRRTMPGLDAEDVQPDRRGEEEGERVVAGRQPEDDRGQHQPAIGRAGSASRRACSQRTRTAKRTATKARWRVCGIRVRGQVRQATGVVASPSPAATPRTAEPVRRIVSRTAAAAPAATHEEREDVHPEGRLAERRQQEVHEPAEDHVGRVAGRVGRAQERRDGLELAGVPVADVRHEPGAHARRWRRG